jgi:hypothetical protein
VVLPGAVRERARVGAGPDHCLVDAVRLPASGCGAGARPGARGGVLRGGEELRVGVVPAEARARRVTQSGCLSLNSLGGGLRPRLLFSARLGEPAAPQSAPVERAAGSPPGQGPARRHVVPAQARQEIRGWACGVRPAPVTWTDATRAYPAVPGFASLRQSWLVLAPQDGGDLLGGHAVKVEMNLGG